MTNDQSTPGGSSLVKKLAEIMGLCHRMEKRGENKFHNYKYVTEADIVDALRGELSKRNIMVIPRIVKQTRTEIERKTKDGAKTALLVDVDMVFSFMDGDSGEVIECPWSGCGEDTGDKALYKAITGADKYFHMKAFMISTGDDPENDTRKRKQVQVPERRPEPARASVAPSQPVISKEQQDQIIALVRDSKIPVPKAKELMLGICGVDQSDKIPANKYPDLVKAIEGLMPVTQ